FECAWMQLAEMPEHVLRADLDRPGASRMKPRRPTRHDLQRRRRRAGGGEHRERVGFGVERIDRGGRGRPMAADAVCFGERAAHAAGGGELILRSIAAEDLSDLEESPARGGALSASV